MNDDTKSSDNYINSTADTPNNLKVARRPTDDDAESMIDKVKELATKASDSEKNMVDKAEDAIDSDNNI